MKQCSTCKEFKDETEFNRKKANSDGLERYCKLCHRTRNKEHYNSNKDTYKASAKKFKSELTDWYKELKSSKSCIRCGESKYWRLSFHHLDRSTKVMEVSQMVVSHASRKRILEEIEKCVAVCHNCHADIHHEEE